VQTAGDLVRNIKRTVFFFSLQWQNTHFDSSMLNILIALAGFKLRNAVWLLSDIQHIVVL